MNLAKCMGCFAGVANSVDLFSRAGRCSVKGDVTGQVTSLSNQVQHLRNKDQRSSMVKPKQSTPGLLSMAVSNIAFK